MTDDQITDLITALGVVGLTVYDVKARLATAKLSVGRVDDDDEGNDIFAPLASGKPNSLRQYRTRQAASCGRFHTTRHRSPEAYYCVVCETRTVDARKGFDACQECLAKQ